jgi:hypothetical protein
MPLVEGGGESKIKEKKPRKKEKEREEFLKIPSRAAKAG